MTGDEAPWRTFTFQLPFPVGVSNDTVFNYSAPGEPPVVGIRFWAIPTAPVEVWPARLADALRHFYGSEIEIDADNVPKWGADGGAVQQWASLQTPSALLPGDDPDDAAFAFHRALLFLNLFLRVFGFAYPDSPARPVTPNEIGYVMAIGALDADDAWTFEMPMIMHPEAFPHLAVAPITPDANFDSAMTAFLTQHPFLRSAEWRRRAQRALRYRGDTSDCVISIQTAAETLLFDLLNMLLVDAGWLSDQIESSLAEDINFKALLTTRLPTLVGGRWDVTASGTAVGDYWNSLYLLRNAVVHKGYEPGRREADTALEVFYRLRDFVDERLFDRRRSYPRSLLARVGLQGLQSRGWLSKRL